MSIVWATIEDAIQAWVVTASGLAGTKVIWEDQNGPRPATPYVALGVEIQRIGQDWTDVEDAAVPSPGAEIEHRARGVRRMKINMQHFGGTATGITASNAVLEAVISKAVLPSVREALTAAGVGVASFSPVTNTASEFNSTNIEPRALLTVVTYLASEVSETGTYISDVGVTDQISTPDNVFTVEGGI